MRQVRTIHEARTALAPIRHGRSVGLVPTMGALHDGHLALVRAARDECDIVVATIFLNPTQFGPGEDLDRYPKTLPHDVEAATAAGVDLLFVPSAEEMYPPGFQTWVEVEEVSRGLEGDARPGHFRGVATVCLKLFSIVGPDRAYFGQKDAQQVAVVERMAQDLALDLEIRVVPTVRDEQGLALSSRNAFLDPDELAAARVLPRALRAGLDAHRNGARPAVVARTILLGEPRIEIDYVDVARLGPRLVLAAAVRVGGTRLIDNVLLEGVEQ